MITFSKPFYTKRPHPTTFRMEPVYQFKVQGMTEDTPIAFFVEDDTPLSLSTLEEILRVHRGWWEDVLETFLRSTASYFTRRYTVSQVEKVLHHRLDMPSSPLPSVPYHVACTPRMIEMCGGIIAVYWETEVSSLQMEIPEEEEPPVISSVSTSSLRRDPTIFLVELNMEELPEEMTPTGSD